MKNIISILVVGIFISLALVSTPSCTSNVKVTDSTSVDTVKKDTIKMKIDTIKVITPVVKK